MSHYGKGSAAERELMRTLYDKGYAVMRSAGSGKNELEAPDVCALKKGKIIGFECKAKKANHLYINLEQALGGVEWARRAAGEYYIAWKIHRQGWRFFKLETMDKKQKSFGITQKEALEKGLDLKLFGEIYEDTLME